MIFSLLYRLQVVNTIYKNVSPSKYALYFVSISPKYGMNTSILDYSILDQKRIVILIRTGTPKISLKSLKINSLIETNIYNYFSGARVLQNSVHFFIFLRIQIGITMFEVRNKTALYLRATTYIIPPCWTNNYIYTCYYQPGQKMLWKCLNEARDIKRFGMERPFR